MSNILQQMGTKNGAEFKAHRLRIEDLEDAVVASGGVSGSTLTLNLASGGTVDIDVSTLLDDSNLSRIESGVVTGTDLVLTRDDATTVSIDISGLATIDYVDAQDAALQSNIDALQVQVNGVEGVNALDIDEQFSAYGYTEAKTIEDRFLETDTPNIVVDKVSEPVRFSDGVYERNANSEAELPVVPFDPTSTDELLDDSVNGLTCQVAHNKGDVVVCGNELVISGGNYVGDFDVQSDIDAFTASNCTLALNANRLELTGYSTNFDGRASFTVENLVVGAEYVLTFSKENGSNGGYAIVGATTITGESHTFTASGTTQYIAFYIDGHTSAGVTTLFDNISVKLKDSIKQATVDTPSSDLTSSDWQTLPQVTTQDVVTLRQDKLTKAVDYHTFRGTQYFGEGYSQYDVMSAYGYSQVSKNLWSDAEYEYVFVGLKNSLNAGGSDPVSNPFGTAFLGDYIDSPTTHGYWYNTPIYKDLPKSIYNAIAYTSSLRGRTTGRIGESVARPDSKFYDKVYPSGLGGLIPSSKYLAYAGKEPVRLLDTESNEVISESWLEEGVETYTPGLRGGNSCFYSSTLKAEVYMPYKTALTNFSVGDVVIITGTSPIFVAEFTIASIEEQSDGPNDLIRTTNIEDMTIIVGTNPSGYVQIDTVTKKQPHLLTYKSATTTDIIGDPANYPSDWLSHLASGKSIVGNANLIEA